MSAKNKQKYFENDLNVNRFLGIFSAYYCWPQECEEDRRPKCWSHVMSESYDWFAAKMWPQVVKKVPIITYNESTVRQINDLFFGLVLKELDLLTASQIQYFESVLDLFNDEITFGVMFWLKVGQQFNWRLIYAKLIVGHKQCRQLTQQLLNEVESKANDKCFTNEDISYFYSLIDCICVQSMANYVINTDDTIDNQFFAAIHTQCSQKLIELSFNPFVRQLCIYNVLTQTLTGFALQLNTGSADCALAPKKLLELEELFGKTFGKIDVEYRIPVQNTRICEDMDIGRDNQKSLDLVNKSYISANECRIELSTLRKFFEYFDNKTKQTIRTKHFTYLTDILCDKQNNNKISSKLIEILISFGDYSTFWPLFTSITALDINNFALLPILSKRVSQSSDQKYFTSLLNKALESATNIDLKSRLEQFKIRPITKANTDFIKTLFNQITNEDNSTLLNDLSQELLIAAYLDPFPVYDMIMDLALHHNRAQIGLIAKLLSNELNCLSTFRLSDTDGQNETFLMKFFVYKFVDKSSIQLVEDMTKLIEQIMNCRSDNDSEPVLALDQLFFYLVKDQCFVKSDLFWHKLLLMKNIIEMSGDQAWDCVQSDPVPTIVYLIQFLDHFWRTPKRKQLVVDILRLVLDKKMVTNLTEDELKYLDEILAKRLPRKASTHKIYLAYCEKRFPKPVHEVIDVRHNIYHDQILHYATITSDFMWICDIYPAYEVFIDFIKTALQHILPALTAEEWLKLFRFLQMYFYNNIAVNLLRSAIFWITDPAVDKTFLIKNLLDIVSNELLIPKRNESLDRPLTYEDQKYVEMDLGVLFKSLATLYYQLLPNDLTQRLDAILTELAQYMKYESINAYALYEDESLLPPIAAQVLQSVYGSNYPTSGQIPVVTIPAGMQASTSISNGCVEQQSAQI